MKKTLKSVMAVAIAALALTACEDVPAPYENPNEETEDTSGDDGEYINETFATSFGDFTVETVTGTPWIIDYSTAKASGYDNDTQETTPSESYLISPAVDLSNSTSAHLEFEYILRYATNYGTADPTRVNKVLITDDYTGDPTTTEWDDITGELTEGSDWTTFYDYIYNLDSIYIGKPEIRVALYYACESQSATWEVRNLKLLEGEADTDTDEDDNDDTSQTAEGDGTEDSPYNVAAAMDISSATGVYVRAYIVGYVSGLSYSEGTVFSADTCTVTTNILIADSPSETDASVCMPVQLPYGEVRNGVNLSENKDNLGQEVLLYGNVSTYFSVPGIREVTFARVGSNEYGSKPSQGSDSEYINETFASSFGSFTVETLTGTPWIIDYSTAKASGYDNSTQETTESESYLISPAIDLTSAESVSISFEYILRYVTNYGTPIDGISNNVLITDNYTGDPSTTTWTDITGELTEGSDWYTFYDYSAAVPNEFIGKSNVVIALYYSCGAESSGTWEVRNLIVADGEVSGSDTPDDGGNDNDDTITGGEVSGNTITVDLSTFGYENAEDVNDITLTDGTVLTFAQEGGNNHPKYYDGTKGVRMYALNSLTVSAGNKTIVGVTLECDSYSGTAYVGNEQLYAEAGDTNITPNVSDTTVTFSGFSSNTLKIINDWTSNSGGTQLRIQIVKITYAE